jgi:hypothetical protein
LFSVELVNELKDLHRNHKKTSNQKGIRVAKRRSCDDGANSVNEELSSLTTSTTIHEESIALGCLEHSSVGGQSQPALFIKQEEEEENDENSNAQ